MGVDNFIYFVYTVVVVVDFFLNLQQPVYFFVPESSYVVGMQNFLNLDPIEEDGNN